jgi:hypothetical protein
LSKWMIGSTQNTFAHTCMKVDLEWFEGRLKEFLNRFSLLDPRGSGMDRFIPKGIGPPWVRQSQINYTRCRPWSNGPLITNPYLTNQSLTNSLCVCVLGFCIINTCWRVVFVTDQLNVLSLVFRVGGDLPPNEDVGGKNTGPRRYGFRVYSNNQLKGYHGSL